MYENQELKSEFGLPTLSEIARVKAEVISGPPSNFDQTITINQGSRKGVAVGMPVITSGGLVGRIEQVTDRQSVVRLLSDPESTVGVRFASAPCSTSAPADTTTTTTAAPPADPNAPPTSPPPADPAAAAAAVDDDRTGGPGRRGRGAAGRARRCPARRPARTPSSAGCGAGAGASPSRSSR